MRCADGGLLASLLAGRRGRGTSSPPQFGQIPASFDAVQDAQNVHSNEQIRASVEEIQRAYAAMAGEINTIMEVSARLEQFNDIARASLSQMFRPSLANRAIGR